MTAIPASRALVICLVAACASAQDTVLLGGKIVTMDPGERIVEALAIRGGRVLAVGTNAEIERLIGQRTEVVRLDGQMV